MAREKKSTNSQPLAHEAGAPNRIEISGLFTLLALGLFFLVTSWRKWPDPLIDFGNNLYTAWRLSNGAVLYRDVVVDYGPLSQIFDGLLFKVFGPGMMVLVFANLVVFSAIASLIYFFFRKAWGPLSAFVAVAIFIAVFAFPQSLVLGNYNYLTPYSEETVHGFLICLILLVVLWRWITKPSLARTFLAGFLFGLTIILKPEFMLANGAMIFAAVLAMRCHHDRYPDPSAVFGGIIGAVLPSVAFAVYFLQFFDWKAALAFSSHAWLSTTQLSGDMAQMRFSGFDRPWLNLGREAVASVMAAVFLAVIIVVSWISDRKIRTRPQAFGLAAGLLVIVGASSCFAIDWRNVGHCLVGITAGYVILCGAAIYRIGADKISDAQRRRWLIAVLALALLSRMILNARIYQYGYYQAALAAILVPSVLLGELPDRLNLQRRGRLFIILGCVALFLPGVVRAVAQSQNLLRLKTAPVASDRDMFYAYPTSISPQAEIVDRTAMAIRDKPEVRSLLVLPEGAMINYLARRPSPIAPLYFYAGVTENGGEEEVVSELTQHPPDLVVVISRDLREYGIRRYGERSGAGKAIVEWVGQNYETIGRAGGDPFEFSQNGALMLQRKVAKETTQGRR